MKRTLEDFGEAFMDGLLLILVVTLLLAVVACAAAVVMACVLGISQMLGEL